MTLTSNEVIRINDSLKRFLQAESVQVRDSSGRDTSNKKVEVTVQDSYGDLENEDFRDLAKKINSEVKEFLLDKYKLGVSRTLIKNSDSLESEVLFNRVTSKVKIQEAEEITEKTRAAELLLGARTSFLDIFDNLVEVQTFLLKTGDKDLLNLADDLYSHVIEKLDGGSSSMIDDLRKILRTFRTISKIC